MPGLPSITVGSTGEGRSGRKSRISSWAEAPSLGGGGGTAAEFTVAVVLMSVELGAAVGTDDARTVCSLHDHNRLDIFWIRIKIPNKDPEQHKIKN